MEEMILVKIIVGILRVEISVIYGHRLIDVFDIGCVPKNRIYGGELGLHLYLFPDYFPVLVYQFVIIVIQLELEKRKQPCRINGAEF